MGIFSAYNYLKHPEFKNNVTPKIGEIFLYKRIHLYANVFTDELSYEKLLRYRYLSVYLTFKIVGLSSMHLYKIISNFLVQLQNA